MAQVIEFLPNKWIIWSEFLASGFWTQPTPAHCKHLGSELYLEDISLFLSLSLSLSLSLPPLLPPFLHLPLSKIKQFLKENPTKYGKNTNISKGCTLNLLQYKVC